MKIAVGIVVGILVVIVLLVAAFFALFGSYSAKRASAAVCPASLSVVHYSA